MQDMITKFIIEQVVYLVSDPDQRQRLVTGIIFRKGHVMYELTYSDMPPTWHYDFEISDQEDVLKRVES